MAPGPPEAAPAWAQVTAVPAPWCWIVYDRDQMVIAHGDWHRGNTAEDVAMEQIALRLWDAQPDFGALSGITCRAWPTGRPDEWVESHAGEWLALIGMGRRGRAARPGAA